MKKREIEKMLAGNPSHIRHLGEHPDLLKKASKIEKKAVEEYERTYGKISLCEFHYPKKE